MGLAVSRLGSYGNTCVGNVDHYNERAVRKTVDGTPRTAKRVNYDSFCYEILIHRGFIFVLFVLYLNIAKKSRLKLRGGTSERSSTAHVH